MKHDMTTAWHGWPVKLQMLPGSEHGFASTPKASDTKQILFLTVHQC